MKIVVMNNKFCMMGETAFAEEGNGSVVVLVHGLGLNQAMWQWQLPVLKKGYRVITYDLLGHGNSAKPSGPYHMVQMVDQLYQLIDALGISRCALIGFSLGGLIVQAFTLAHPDRVSALAILHAAHGRTPDQRASILRRVEQCRVDGPGATVSDALSRWFSIGFAKQNITVLEKIRLWVLANDPLIYPELYQLLAEADIGLEDSVASIKCPTLVMTGDEDYGNSAEMAQRIASTIPNAQLKILKGLRHMALAEDPEQVNRLLIHFLDEFTEKPELQNRRLVRSNETNPEESIMMLNEGIETLGGPVIINDRKLSLSKAVRAGNFIFLTGQIPMIDGLPMTEGSIEAQTQNCIEHIQKTLTDCGCNLSNVVKSMVWLKDRTDFPGFNSTYNEYFKDNPPARSALVSDFLVDIKVEIECVAYITDQFYSIEEGRLD